MRYNKVLIIAITALSLASCGDHASLEGKWKYAGGIYDGKKEGSTEGYQLERTYTSKAFEANMIEANAEPQKFQAGNYELKGDTCIETETFSTQPSKLTNVGVHYHYQVKNDTLTLKAKLPTGMQVEEYWTKLK